MCLETYRDYNIWQNTRTVWKRNPVSGHQWPEYIDLKSMYISGPGSWHKQLFFSIKKAREHIDYLIFVENFINERELSHG